jgi:hypothetical protein
MSTIKISLLGNLTTVQGNVIVPVVGNVAGTLTTLQSNVSQLQTYILGTVVTDLANLTALTTANAAVQSGAIADVTTAWQANATAQLSQIEGANAAIVTANTALKGYVDAQDTIISNSVTGANAAIVTANTALKGYVDAAITTVGNSVTGANAAIVTANTALKGYVDGQITSLINGAPGTLDTLNEIANALGSDANLSVTLTSLISNVQSNVTSSNTAMTGYVDAVTTAWEANAETQLTSINNITNGTATFGNIIPSANVTYSLGSETAQWKELWVSGNTINLGGQTISATPAGIVMSGNITTTGGAYEVTEFWDISGFIGSGPWLSEPTLYEQGYQGVAAPVYNVESNGAGYISNVTIDNGGVYPYDQIDLYTDDCISISYDSAEEIEFVDILGEDVKPFGGANATSFTDNVTYTGLIYNGTVNIELNVSKIYNAPASDDEFISIDVIGFTVTGTTAADILGRYVYISNNGNVYDTTNFADINGTSELILQDLAFYAKLTNPRTATGDRINYAIGPVGQSNLSPVSSGIAITSNIGMFSDSVYSPSGTIDTLNAVNLTVSGNLLITGDTLYTMGNVTHWTSNVFTFTAAINQLAERIWNIENPV